MKNSYSFVDEVRSSPYYNAFDPYEDFCQVLEEAKQHGQEAGSRLLEPEKEKLAAVRIQVKDKNSKKSWKVSSVISWLRGGKLRAKPPSNPAVLKPNNVSVSGPMCSGEGRDYVKPKLQLSGQLNGLFTPLKKVETSHSSMQYGSLPKPDSKSSNGPYGPMYTVR